MSMLVYISKGDNLKEIFIKDQDLSHTHTLLSRLQNSTPTHEDISLIQQMLIEHQALWLINTGTK